ncbi:hypothetical protein BD309DRAFT_875954 [Dichomitus squalens]|nr:hypothetical protein BD309DRAFT_875954 [Dichomitus squalens]
MYTTILAPIARALKALESTDATAADVFVFWLGIVSSLHDLFRRPEFETGISQPLIKKVTTIVNTRYKEIIDSAPTDVYFTAFFLHPKHSRSDILRKPVNPLANVIVIPSARDDSDNAPIPRAYRRAKEYLKRQLQEEIMRNTHPLIKKLGEVRVAEELRAQLMAYAHGQYPFDTPLEETESGRPVLDWWQNLESHAHARVLAMLAIKLYSIAINSMADERTASNFTWFNSSLRNRQQVGTLVDMIQVRQWYLAKVRLQDLSITEITMLKRHTWHIIGLSRPAAYATDSQMGEPRSKGHPAPRRRARGDRRRSVLQGVAKGDGGDTV